MLINLLETALVLAENNPSEAVVVFVSSILALGTVFNG